MHPIRVWWVGSAVEPGARRRGAPIRIRPKPSTMIAPAEVSHDARWNPVLGSGAADAVEVADVLAEVVACVDAVVVGAVVAAVVVAGATACQLGSGDVRAAGIGTVLAGLVQRSPRRTPARPDQRDSALTTTLNRCRRPGRDRPDRPISDVRRRRRFDLGSGEPGSRQSGSRKLGSRQSCSGQSCLGPCWFGPFAVRFVAVRVVALAVPAVSGPKRAQRESCVPTLESKPGIGVEFVIRKGWSGSMRTD